MHAITHSHPTVDPGVASLPGRAWAALCGNKLQFALIALLSALTLIPVVSVLVGSFRPEGLPLGEGWTVEHYAAIWGSPYMFGVLLRTFVFAASSAALAIAIAGTLAWLVERTDMPGRDYFKAAIILPMATPPVILAIGWVLIMSPRIGLVPAALRWISGPDAPLANIYGMGGMIFVQGVSMVPTSFLILAPVMRNMNPAFEEAASMSGAGFLQTVRRVSLPFLVPATLSLVTFLMILGMLTFDVPAIIGMPANVTVMSSEIFGFMNPPGSVPDFGKSAALNSSLFVLLGNALALYYYITKNAERFSAISGKAYQPRRFRLGNWGAVATAFVTVYFVAAVVLPFLMILWISVSPYFTGFDPALLPQVSFRRFLATMSSSQVWHATFNSLVVSLCAASALTILSLVAGWTVIRSGKAWAKVIDILAMLPIAVPHLMMGIALVFIFFSLRFIPIYGTVWILVLAHVIVFLPVAMRMMQAAILQLHVELEEAAVMSGASQAQTIRRVILPLCMPSVVSLFVWVLVHSMREFSASVILRSGNSEVLSTVLYSFWDNGKPDAAAAIAVSMMLVLSVIVFVSHRYTARRTVGA